ncbi:hypothetical protein FRC12_015172 [Ceratobasidium sp. 428]|nr:hypothetical protein FRC12_015172 [Ceratobasidium sp. 428]
MRLEATSHPSATIGSRVMACDYYSPSVPRLSVDSRTFTVYSFEASCYPFNPDANRDLNRALPAKMSLRTLSPTLSAEPACARSEELWALEPARLGHAEAEQPRRQVEPPQGHRRRGGRRGGRGAEALFGDEEGAELSARRATRKALGRSPSLLYSPDQQPDRRDQVCAGGTAPAYPPLQYVPILDTLWITRTHTFHLIFYLLLLAYIL